MSNALHVFLSPHLDDVVLSCGGTISWLARRGERVIVATPFAGDPEEEVMSPFGRRHLRLWQTPITPMAVRRAEDRDALRLLGAEAWHGLHLDAPFRRDRQMGRWLYTDDAQLFGEPNPEEADLPQRLVGEVSTLFLSPDVRVYVPLALGRHVDHLHLRQVGHILSALGYTVWAYEDYPYVEMGVDVKRLAARGWQAQMRVLGHADAKARVEAIQRYRSQVPSLFGKASHVQRRVLDYMLTVGGKGQPAERFWRLR